MKRQKGNPSQFIPKSTSGNGNDKNDVLSQALKNASAYRDRYTFLKSQSNSII
jgi:hypothetical protein